MLDSNFLAFVGVAAVMVLNPGPTWAVVTDGAIEGGRPGGLWTVAGIGTANFSLATASAFGLSALFHRFPPVLHVITIGGAAYMAWLGARAMRRALKGYGVTRKAGREPRKEPVHAPKAIAQFGRGLITNLTNVSVLLFYTVLVPQFIGPQTNVLGRYLLLNQTHVVLSIGWMTALALLVGTVAEHMTRPTVRRAMDVVTGLALLAFAAKIALSA